MIQRTIEQLAEMIKVENDVSAFKEHSIKGVAFDTRIIEEGNLFVPLRSEKADGHQYVQMALENGAAAVLWQKDEPNPPKNAPVLIVEDTLLALQELAHSYRKQVAPKVVGITGSNGKTTTKDIAASVFSEKYRVHKTDGNFNNHIGLPITILLMPEDTEVLILEMGMNHTGEISVLTKIACPDVAIITNIGEAHLQELGSRKAIAEAKLEIIEGLTENGLLVYPGSELLVSSKVSSLHQYRFQTFGESSENDLYPAQIKIDENGSTFIVPGLSNESLFIPLAGNHNVQNALAVILAARELFIPTSSIKQGLKSVKMSNMRMEWHQGIKGTKILNDAYNASPTSMRAVISMFSNMKGEKIVVLGDMLELGEEEINYHQQIGDELDPRKIKYVFTYGNLGKYIAKAAKQHFKDDHVFAFTNKDELIATLTSKIIGNEIILFKASRGVKLEEVVDALKR
ncbi:UDP-N-acetylmuramoyl-tripeptide--D-alanyl-D-alanine ligase [Bacillus niameyensis]|uniref:UDP-N-acetylmuramoyl-tripeptide--D-alanyl-D- alanine ligase n=1 Tax=Bacillus niameyensis TaxID=1522308 RepID=UPI0007851577|nr:UDP-N-acetylmuramoyl-tripeptide--D-alanyl-D-alanine ligase [Bacillus niameyensis]